MKIIIWKGVAGLWYFHIKAKNGEIVASSEGYKRKSSCLKTVEAIRRAKIEVRFNGL